MSNLSEVNISVHTGINRFTLHNNSDNITLRLLRSIIFNTLNSKLKVKAILVNKWQLLVKAWYLEATFTFLRFEAKHYSIAQLFGGSYKPCVTHSKLCEGKLFKRKSKPHTMSEKRHKINKFANYQNIMVRNSPAFDCHVFVSTEDRWSMVFDVMRMISTQIRWQDPCWSLCKLWEHRLDFI